MKPDRDKQDKACRFSQGKNAPAQHQLIELFWQLAPGFTRWAESRMEEQGMTPQRLRLMGLLMDNGSMTMGALSDELGVSATNVTALVDALEKDGMVERKPHPTDRRAIMIQMTAKAEKKLAEGCAVFKDRVAELFSSFNKTEQGQFVQYLSRMRQALVDRGILEDLDAAKSDSAEKKSA